MIMRTIQTRLNSAVSLVGPSLAKAGWADRVDTISSLIDNNEEGIALELLCSNLYEFDIPIPFRAFGLIREVGQEMNENGAGYDSDLWLDLESLVKG